MLQARASRSAAIAAGLLLSSIAPFSQAKCAGPHAVLSPRPGSALPLDPVLYFFWPKRDKDQPQVKARGAAGDHVPVEQTKVAETESYTAYRVRVKTSKPGALTLELPKRDFYYGPSSWRYELRADWQRPAQSEGAPTVRSESFRWTCSYQLSQNLQLPGHAVAYRLLISDATDPAKAGVKQALYVPPRMRQFFERDERPASGDSDQIELGYINCFGNTFTWQGKPILVDIYALFADGSEQRLGSAPMRVEPPAPGDNARQK
jgi:hypothetical protein